MKTQTTLTVANEILKQLGGSKFLAMTGSKNLAGDSNSLQMHLTANKAKAKYLRIVLNENDTYTMTFSTIKNFNFIVIKEMKGVYNDMLKTIFENVTGLRTSL